MLPSAERLLHELRVHQIELEMQNEELRRAQLALEESRDRYVDLYDFAPVGYVTLSGNGLIQDINLTATTLLGMDRIGLWQTRFSALVAVEDCDCWHRFLMSVMRDADKTRRSVELSLVRHDGRSFHAQLDCVRIAGDAQDSSLRIALTDITARKQAEAEQRAVLQMEHLRQLAVEEMLTEQRERHAIATDLHDGLGQTLHVARIKLGTLAKGVAAGSGVTSQIDELSGLLAEASREVRSLTSKLSPPALMDLGLVPALSWLAAEMERVYGLTVSVDDDGAPKPLTQSQAAILFRAVRELLINVAKHAGTAAARVEIRTIGRQLRLIVEDKGSGIGNWRGTVMDGKGFGLPSVHERTAFLGGTMGVKTSPGDGTTVILEIPLESPERAP
ncbi:Signal transduction histidine kinase [Paramagnetospirillum caucaseum]|uniref:Oxygen sensor histidine kinase NreB n=1 Tax=Paramagnetospirillum caucaseum TaxID=1244869 RepID=M2YCJ2_9PROT|nr:Signal transduction histidine kinase [Paramagnetospirillum caucaseum]